MRREIRCWSLRVQRNEWDEGNYERKIIYLLFNTYTKASGKETAIDIT